VLDNFEQVIDAAPLVAELLTSVIVVRLLVTSRAPLHVRGEREYVVGPLAMEVGSDALSPPDLARAAAVRLFLERVRERSSLGVMVPCPRARTRWARSPA
jgi:predicted ATPase